MTDREQETVERVRGGDIRAYAWLVDRYKDRALTLACRIVGDRGKAEELVQDAFLRAYRNLDRFKGESRFGTWFYRILYNICISSTRGLRDRPEHIELTEERVSAIHPSAASEPSILESIADSDLHGHVAAELALLPDTYRVILTLFYTQELSYEEIAGVLDAPLGTVKAHLFRGRALLRGRVLERLKEEVKAA